MAPAGTTVAAKPADDMTLTRNKVSDFYTRYMGANFTNSPHELVARDKWWIQICISPRIPAFNMKIGSADTSFENFNFYITRTRDRLRYLS
jgi:hypothetical protein